MNKKEVEIKSIERILELIDSEIERNCNNLICNKQDLYNIECKIQEFKIEIERLKLDTSIKESLNKTLLKERGKYKKDYKRNSGIEYKSCYLDFDEINIFMN